MEIGFIGLGQMGQGIASNLLKAKYNVKVWNRTPSRAKALEAQGAIVVEKAADLTQSDIVFSMLADDAAVRSVIFDGGVLDAMRAGSIHINLSTISVGLAREMTESHGARKVGYIASPVLGRPDVAAAGKLNILVAGKKDLVKRAQPLLDKIGQKTWYFGDRPEQANVVKLGANFMIASAIEMMGEASTLVEGYDIDVPYFLEMITTTLFAAPVYQGYGGMIAKKQFEPAGFRMTLGLKDIHLAIEAAEERYIPLPFASVVKNNLLEGIAHGWGNKDWASLSIISG
ncbi:MAG: NAD(P)-dependent oxidoreductase [Zymomonas mobilis subsp. pomaceae]|uniref:NAD(P)-dependent oxidoreductase n=1 Tax=Zymomonas mobilis TaxID=542 RepID=UPI0039EB9000